tara:strand:- start:3213 stop:3524 length:312 start_codon:yes stop_codon:yes gene_type:complete
MLGAKAMILEPRTSIGLDAGIKCPVQKTLTHPSDLEMRLLFNSTARVLDKECEAVMPADELTLKATYIAKPTIFAFEPRIDLTHRPSLKRRLPTPHPKNIFTV